ncbi:hypothetical protein K9L16_03160 [Candidatus Pacearchaeota archaeon]|nr:hypothetical protein [Candidatus Pacearchaeota archaeon]
MVTIVYEGKLEQIDDAYIPIIDAIKKHGINYPDYLTPRQVMLADSSTQFFDGLVEKFFMF